MSLKRAGQSLLPQLTRGFRSSAARSAGQESGLTHEKIAMGDGHHGLRPGYNYDWEHGPHYLRPDTVPNFSQKWTLGMAATFTVAIGIPVFAVWWQQRKLKTA